MSDECLITQRSMVMMGRKGKSYQLDRKKLVNFINMQQFPNIICSALHCIFRFFFILLPIKRKICFFKVKP